MLMGRAAVQALHGQIVTVLLRSYNKCYSLGIPITRSGVEIAYSICKS